MNKKAFVLPVVAALILAGCTMGKSTKKKKKSSSVEISSTSDDPKPGTSNTAITSTTAPAPTSGTTAPAPTSGTTTPAPTSASTTTAPTPGTSSTTTIPPTPTTSEIPPVTGWSASELQVFTNHFHGIVPPYTSVGLDLESEESEEGHYAIYSNQITETQIDEYFDAADSSWTVKTEGSGDDAYEYLYKASSDGTGHVEISAYYDLDDDDNVIYFLGFEWFDDGGEVPPAGGGWTQVTSRPADGTNFLIGLNNGSDTFLDGTMKNTYYPNCEATVDSAIRFTVATSGEGFTIQAISGSVSGKYLGISVSGTHVNAVYDDTAYVWSWCDTDTYQSATVEAHTFGAREDGGYGEQWYILAQQSGNTTVSPTYNKWWSSNYIARLYQYVEA